MRHGKSVPGVVRYLVRRFALFSSWFLFCFAGYVEGYDCDVARTCSFGEDWDFIASAKTADDLSSFHVAALARYQKNYQCALLNNEVNSVRSRLGITKSRGRYTTLCDSVVPTDPNDMILIYFQLAIVVLIGIATFVADTINPREHSLY